MNIKSCFTKENAIFAAKVAVGVVVVGGAIAGAGYLMESAGTQLLSNVGKNEEISNIVMRNLGKFLQSSGGGLFLVGKYTSYTVLVPGYIVGYKFPKWMVEQGIPKVISFVQDYVLEPIGQGIEWLQEKAIVVIRYVDKHLLQPAIKKLGELVHELLKNLQWVGARIVDVVTWTWDNVLVPIGKGIEKVVKAVAEHLIEGMKWVADRVIDVATWTRDHLLIPLGKVIEKVIRFVEQWILDPLGKGIKWAVNHMIDAVIWTRDNLLIPLGKVIEKVAKAVGEFLVDATNWVVNRVIDVATWMRDHLLIPLRDMVEKVVNFASHYLVEIAKWVVGRIVDIATWTWEKLLQPVAEAADIVVRFVFKYFIQLPYQTIRDWVFYPLIDRIVEGGRLANQYLIQPIVKVAGQILSIGAKAFSYGAKQVSFAAQKVVAGVSAAGGAVAEAVQNIYIAARKDISSLLSKLAT